jgi:outer membrane protein
MVRGRRIFIVVPVVVALVSIGLAAAEPSLTIDEAVAMALKQNLGLQRDRISLETARRALDSSWNAYLPNASASVGALRSNSSTESFGDSLTAYGQLKLSLSLSPSILERPDKIRLEYESGLITYTQAERALELSVRKAYYLLLLADDSVRLAEQNIEREQRSLAATEQKHRAGLVPEIDLLSAQVSLAKLTPKLESAQAARANAMDSFKLLLGLDIGEPVQLSGDVGSAARAVRLDSARAAVEQSVGKERLDIQALEKSLQIARSAKRMKELDSFAPSLGVDLSTKPQVSRWASGGSYLDGGLVTLSLSLPLDAFVAGSSAKTAVAECDDAIRKLEIELLEAERSSRNIAQSYLRSVEAAISSLAALEKNAALAEKAYNLTYQAYQTGYKSLSDVSNAAAALDQARSDVLSEASMLVEAALGLEDALNVPFGTLTR